MLILEHHEILREYASNGPIGWTIPAVTSAGKSRIEQLVAGPGFEHRRIAKIVN